MGHSGRHCGFSEGEFKSCIRHTATLPVSKQYVMHLHGTQVLIAHSTMCNAGPFDRLPCNTFAWCGAEVCFEPDAHHHTLHDCWLKFTEAPMVPELNMRGRFPDWYCKKHPDAPAEVQWVSGVLLPDGVQLTNGTWSVRWHW
jgi:hypothetical protein